MPALLFRAVLSSGIRMALPLGMGLLLLPLGRKHIRPRTLFSIQKLMMAGMLFALALTLLGPLVRVPVPYQPPVTEGQTYSALPMPGRPTITLLQTTAEEPAPAAAAAVPSSSLWEAAGTVWLCGAGTLLLVTLVQNARFFRRVSKNSAAVPAELGETALLCGLSVGLRTVPKVRVTPEVSSPMAAGCLRPVVFLPVRVLLSAPEEQRLLLSHEFCHCKTRDNLWRLFSSLLLAVYWFDPLVWALARSFSTQCELCCDENVLSGATVQTRKVYGQLILSFVARQPRCPLVPSLQSGWRESFGGLKLRLGQIVSSGRKRGGKVVLAGCVLVFLLFSGMVGRKIFSPSEVLILPDNPEGLAWSKPLILPDNPSGLAYEERHDPQKIFPIRPPIRTDRVFRTDFYDNDGSLFYDNLYFLANTEREEVVAGCSGVVAAVQKRLPPVILGTSNDPLEGLRTLGKFVIIDCGDGLTVRYTYLSSVRVEVGQWVSAGDVIGTAGNTGSSYGTPDQCGVFVMQDGLMVDTLLFFDVSPEYADWSKAIKD